jgi:hypothetical protein
LPTSRLAELIPAVDLIALESPKTLGIYDAPQKTTPKSAVA